MSKPSARTGLGSLATGAMTGAALVVQTGVAALVGVIIAREYGRTAETDGFFAAYGIFLVLALVANAVRLVVLPPLARARDDRRLGQETAAWAVSLGAVAAPLLLVALIAAGPIAGLLTGSGPDAAQDAAADALPLLALAGVGQVYAGLAASALAALDDYLTPALGYIGASVVGLAVILLRLDSGIVAVAEGMALNALLAVAVPVVVLALRAHRAAMPATGVRPQRDTVGNRIARAARGSALPLALQIAYLVCLPLAAREGVGAVTSFGYAYIIGSAVVAATASSLGLVTSVPLTRFGLDPERVARHVDASSWFALLAIGATGGVFWLAGGAVLSSVLGEAYSSDVSAHLGEVVVALTPWMVASVALSVSYPLVFIGAQVGRLPIVALATIVVLLPTAVAGQAIAGLSGLALALAAATGVAVLLLLSGLHAVRPTLEGLASPIAVVAGLTLLSFVPAGLLLDDPILSAAVGLLAFGLLVLLFRPRGLRDAWHYLRALA